VTHYLCDTPSARDTETGSEAVGLVLGDTQLPFELPKSLPELRKYLQGALEIEHLAIPPYLTAMYTIRAGTNKAAYYAIRSVALEDPECQDPAPALLPGGDADLPAHRTPAALRPRPAPRRERLDLDRAVL
jgi:hypothetical protein